MRKHASSSKAITATKDLTAPTKKQPKTYEATDHGLIRWEFRQAEGWTPIQIANFTARVVEDLRIDDGVVIGHEYRMEAILDGGKRTETIDLSSTQFDRMNWLGRFGIGAIINPGCERQVRAAIKYLSAGQYSSRNVYRHTGWRTIGSRMLYLHAGGAIAKTGPIRTVETKLSSNLSDYVLPAPPRTQARLTEVIASLLRFLDVAPDRITVPLLSAMCRSVLGGAKLTVHLTAKWQTGKTELAALMLQCFGPLMNADTPKKISWSSTENFLEQMAFEAKDTLLLIDDFKPNGTPQNKQEWHSKADRVIRAQGNRAGRGRLNADLETVASKPPRGLILSTGEETPNGQSLQSRMVVLQVSPEDINKKLLTRCQEDAGAGLYAEAAAAYIRWLPDYLDRMEALFFTELNRYRQIFHGNAKGLQRAPDNIFQLAIALRVFLSFAVQMNGLTIQQAQAVWSRATHAYAEAMRTAQTLQSINDPELRFFELLNSLIDCGAGHIASAKDGGAPAKADELWGWKQREAGRPGVQPQGVCLGWIHKDGLFLQEAIVWPEVRNVAERCNERFEITFTQLKRQLFQRKLLLTCDIENPQRRCFTVRKTCAGKLRELLHVSPNAVTGGVGAISADKADKSRPVEATWEKLSDFTSFFVGKQKANRQIVTAVDSDGLPRFVGNVGKSEGYTPNGSAEGLGALSEHLSEGQNVPTKNAGGSDKNGRNGHHPKPSNLWQGAGFASSQDFEKWYESLYAAHPTRGGLKAAQSDLAELIAEGTLRKEAFEAGYEAHRRSAAWTREGGRFIPKLSTFVQDRGWMFPPVEATQNKPNAENPGSGAPHNATAAERRAERLRNI